MQSSLILCVYAFSLCTVPGALGQSAVPKPVRPSAITVEKVAYGGWPNCYRLTNGVIELIVTTDVGPRVIRFGFNGGGNEFKEYKDQLGQVGGEEWRIYGGHRLWHAPEAKPRTYWPDNIPVEAAVTQNGIRLIQPVEGSTGIQKEIELIFGSTPNHVSARHLLRNRGAWPIELAPWALTVMEQGGMVIIPQPPYKSHDEELLPLRPMAIWGYTNMRDPRYLWGSKYIVLTQDSNAVDPTKIGVGVIEGWAAYVRRDHLFLKRFEHKAGERYPDFGSSVESFTNADMIELETLGPLARIEPGSTVVHVEEWYLFKGIGPITDEDSIDQHILPKVKSTEQMTE